MNVQDLEKLPFKLHKIFNIQTEEQFLDIALRTFHFQYENCAVYRQYVQLLGRNINDINKLEDIPFMPITFFKTQEVKSFDGAANLLFESSGTTSQERSKHYVLDPTLYQLSFLKGFEMSYGHVEDYIILGLLPSYMDNDNSSLIYMVDHLIQLTNDHDSGFFLNDYDKMLDVIHRRKHEKKILLIGVSYALLDLAEKHNPDLSGCIIMETGGMKGRRKELTKEELHKSLKIGFNVDKIHSEYGMTELLSQAYSKGEEIFNTPPWMKILLRKPTDPFEFVKTGSGGINVIDLANIHSCAFVQTDDLGKKENGGFKILGRFDNTDLRGCNLLVQ